jgi:hypothetical protein
VRRELTERTATRSLIGLEIGPNLDPLRKNPRFEKLVAGGK